MINMSRVIRSMGKVHDFERVTAGFESGLAQEEKVPFRSMAIIQPAGKDDLELLEEGQRSFPTQLIHSIEPLKNGDYMHYKGDRWKVVNAQDWSDYGCFRCIAIRLAGTETNSSKGFTVV